MAEGVLVDSSAWGFYFRRNPKQPAFAAAIADELRGLVIDGAAWIHPVVAGEVLLGGVDPASAFDGLPWLDVSRWTATDVLEWMTTLPRDVLRRVGWADCCIVHGAIHSGLPLLTGEIGQRALWATVRPGR